ncbi:hypothetical protein LP52_11950 [Streptomonospora alba]|uniref:Transglutaminase-like domain-containing protein n=1 Tax=Streptomonospora alba TaxID=183763 RepID=A0A0C2JIF2_9ACTN|nr:DUF3488 and transglutaminase-like domain-containing protein [Streptomonospora alba]KIH98660.1 hypothetical protein LP52_11950 [Streptomonospora alba]
MLAKAALTLATAAALLLALPALAPLIAGDSWWGPAAAVVAACAAAGLGLRAARVPVAVVPLLQAAVVLCVLIGAFVPYAAPLGFVPTSDSLSDLVAVFTEGRAQIGTETTPIPATPALALVVAAAMGLLAIVSDFLGVTARAAAMTALPLAGLLLVPLLVDDQGLSPFAFAGAAAGYVVLLAVDGWVRDAGWGVPVRAAHDTAAPVLGGVQHIAATAGVAAVAVALALVVPLAVPGLSSNSLYALADGSRLGGETVTTTHPLVSLRRDLSSTSDRPVLTYSTDSENPDYLRMYSLDAFDGQNWTMSRLRAEGDGDLDDEVLPSPPGQTYIASERTTTEITLADRFETDFLPMPYPPRELSASGEWYADPDTLMVFTTGAPARGDDYEVTSLVNEPDLDALAADMEPGGELDERYLEVPGSVDERTAELAASITSEADTAHDKAVALQEWFTRRGGFSYDLTPPSVPAGEDPLSYFLFDNRVGYCEQFAGAMALLARQAGIPARVAIGYTSGAGAGEGTWEVTESDAHAWPELYFQGAGWLRFEPTPASPGGQGTATVPDYAEGMPSAPQGGQAQGPQNPQGDSGTGPSAEPEAPQDQTESEDPAATEEEGRDGLAGGPDDGRGLGWWAALVLPAVLVAAVLPAFARFLVRRARWVRAGSATQRARAAWRELRDDSRDLGLAWGAAESPRAVAQRLSDDLGLEEQARAAVWRLAMGEESARYAPEFAQEGTPSDDSRRVRAALRAACGRAAALRAVVLPRSLLPAPPAPVAAPSSTAAPGTAAG